MYRIEAKMIQSALATCSYHIKLIIRKRKAHIPIVLIFRSYCFRQVLATKLDSSLQVFNN